MASYALLGSLSGFRYSAVTKTLWFGPELKEKKFRTFFSTAGGYGTITLSKNKLTIRITEGHLAVETLYLTMKGKTRSFDCGLTARPGKKLVLKMRGG
jgi:hypothetical protein